jgi:nucleoside-diphosphate-sugar epimerase
MVDLQDVAEAASAVLSEAGHAGATYELCGAEVLSQREIAIILGEQLGQEVRGERVPIEKWEQQARSAGLSDYAVQTLVRMFRYYERNDFWGNPQVLGWLIGRSPTTFPQFLQRIISASTAP